MNTSLEQPNHPGKPHLRPIARTLQFALGIGLLAGTSFAIALPQGAEVAAGTATMTQQGNVLTVNNSANAILNWQKFNIGVGESTRFIQPSATSAVLNRVIGGDPSRILGTLSSNGRVFLINPTGILFGAGAKIDTAGFVASTLNLTDQNFLQGKLQFEGNGARMLNEGDIKTLGNIYLVAPDIQNSGTIRSENGSVVLAAGQKVLLSDADPNQVVFEVQAPSSTALNLGNIEASKSVAVFANSLRHSGAIKAVDMQTGTGGKVILTGADVRLGTGSNIDASAPKQGGTVLIGGDYQGKNPEIRNATTTTMEAGAQINASATDTGDGGKVILWADDKTTVHGRIAARGGDNGGNGGFIETSGKHGLTVTQAADAGASRGLAGTWLLDPDTIEITSSAGSLPGPNNFTASGASTVQNTLINSALNAGTAVTVTAIDGITVNAPINKTAGPATSLTMAASAGPISINDQINATGFALDVNLTGTSIFMGGVGKIDAGNGNVTLNGGAGGISLVSAGNNVTANGLEILSSGNVSMSTEPNSVNTLAVNMPTSGTLNFWNNKALTIGTVGGSSGIDFNGHGGSIYVKTTAGGLTVNAPIASQAGAITLRAASGIALNAGGNVSSWFNDTAGSGVVSLQADSGNITQTNTSAISGNSLTAQATAGILLSDAENIFASAQLNNSSTGNIEFKSNLNLQPPAALAISGNNNGGDFKVNEITKGLETGNLGATGMTSLQAGGAITQAGGTTLGGTSLRVSGSSVNLPQANPVGVIAGTTLPAGNFSYRSINTITLDSVDGINGITAGTGGIVTLDSTTGINQNSGAILTADTANLMVSGAAAHINLDKNNQIGALSATSTSGSIFIRNAKPVLVINGPLSASSPTFGKVAIDALSNIIQFSGATGTISAGAGINLYASGITLDNTNPGQHTLNANSGMLLVAADTFDLGGVRTINATGGVILTPRTASRPIEIHGGTCGQPGTALCLDATQLDSTRITASELAIGRHIAESDPNIGSLPAAGSISINAPLNRSAFSLYLGSANSIMQTAGIQAATLAAVSASDSVTLNHSGNMVGKIVGQAPASKTFTFNNAQSLTVGSVTPFGGPVQSGVGAGTVVLSIPASTATLTLGAPVTASTSATLSADSQISGSGMLTAPSLTLTSSNGSLGTLALPLNTTTSTLTGTAAGDIHIANTGNLTIPGSLQTSLLSGTVKVGTNGTLTLPPGSIVRTGESGSILFTASGDINIGIGGTAEPNVATLDALNGTVSVTSTGGTVTKDATAIVIGTYSASSAPPPGPTLAECTANPTLVGCSTVLPSLSSCISNPALEGCSAVLPSLASCTSDPTLPGCSVVLPSLTTCTSAPTTPGCSAVLPSLATCTSDPSTPGCSAVLPTLATCTSAPTTPGCSAVLPSLATCTSDPGTPGCSAVLPSLATCTSAPTTPGCSAVLPSLATCTSDPSTPGCSAILPSLATCTTAPTTPGCSAVLPSLATCTSDPSTPGCSAVLPTLATCTSAPTTPGCSVVLPTLATCTSAPSTPGCSAVLPSLATCTSAPSMPGCSAVLPSLAACTSTPSLPGCQAVLPSLASCSSNPSTPGCAAVLPSTTADKTTVQSSLQQVVSLTLATNPTDGASGTGIPSAGSDRSGRSGSGENDEEERRKANDAAGGQSTGSSGQTTSNPGVPACR